MFRIAAVAVFAALVPAASEASSPEAWEEFRTDVAAKCLAAAKTTGMNAPEVLVHPLGTQTYGLAVLREGADKRICVYVKQTQKVELTPAT